MADATPGSSAPSSNRNVMILLSYLWLLALIPLVVEKDDREVQWHAKHGLVLTVRGVDFLGGVSGRSRSCSARFSDASSRSSRRSSGSAFLILHIFAIIKGINGQRLIVPGISQYADKF